MGNLTAGYKKAIFDELLNSITSNTSQYYAFASNPVAYSGNTPAITNDDYSSKFTYDWQMLFGKKLQPSNIMPVVNYIPWVANTSYSMYDNTQDLSNSAFYVVTPPVVPGAAYNIYKCISNANGAPSTVTPSQIISTTFYTADNYGWRYITSINALDFNNFATPAYIPAYTNNFISASAANNAGVDVVMISNNGSGYNSYHDGYVQSVNTSVIQIAANASFLQNFYTNNAIYLYNVVNTSPTTSQLYLITQYISNTSGNWIYTNAAVNTASVAIGQAQYKISPAVIFTSDGAVPPLAYTIVNPAINSVANVIMINTGTNISWANAYITSNASYGSGATIYPIVPPPGGHGSNAPVELNMQGFSVSFTFANTEANTIPVNIPYNKIGLIKNPSILLANGAQSTNTYYSNTFIQALQANVSGATLFPVGTTVKGQTSNAYGTVAFSNTTVIYLTGDKSYVNNETIVSTSNSSLTTTLTINTLGSIFAKNIFPLYLQNISNVNRVNTQSEAFKLIIQL